MQAEELASILYGTGGAAERFEAAAQRWNRVRSTVSGNVRKISRSDLGALEPVSRLRTAIQRRAADFSLGEWVDKAWDALPATARGGVGASDDARERADIIAEWSKKGSADAVRKLGEEALLGTNDLVSVEFFERALKAAESVGCINVMGQAKGTGFLVGEGVVATNHHVIDSPEQAAAAVIVMNLEENRVGPAKSQEEFAFEPERFFHTDKALDVTLVAARTRSDRDVELTSFGHLPLIRGEGKILIGQHTNIIQHPSGENKKVAFRQGVLVELTNQGTHQDFSYYTSDTGRGSSGSPVFNDSWQVVALHHHGLPKLDVNGNVLDKNGRQISREAAQADPSLVAWVANEGTRVSRVVANLEGATLGTPAMESVRAKLLALWNR